MASTKITPKQIKKLVASFIRVNSFSFPSAASANVTTVTTSALTSAGYNGVAVTLAASTAETTAGVIVSGNNKVEVYKSSDKTKLSYFSEEVYGRVTESSGTYTLSLYSLQSGVETAYTPVAP